MKKIYFNFNRYSRYFLSGLFLSMMLLWSANSYAQYSGGNGTEGDPYQIATTNDLIELSNTSGDWDKHFIQTDDIAFDATEANVDWNGNGSTGPAEGFSPIGNTTTEFEGSYDGDGHTISNLYIDRSSTDDIGLFGYTYDATIQNTGVVDVDITGDLHVGGLVGYNDNNSSVSNAYSTGVVTGDWYVGGLVGVNSNSSTISKSNSSGSVTGNIAVGGLVGNNSNNSIVENSYSGGSVTGNKWVGGLVGDHTDNSTVSNSYSTGSVTGSDNHVGGLVGYNYKATVSNSYSHGDVTRASGTNTDFGGFCGYNDGATSNATIEYCYSTGDVFQSAGVAWASGDKGFVGGEEDLTTYTANFFDSEASNQSSDALGAATAEDTDDMTTRSTFTGEDWDFENIWAMSSYNDGYPNLDEEGSEFTWDGSVSSAWNTAGNWNQDLVPAGFDNATVASTATDPVVNSGVGASCKDLTVNSGAILTINDGGSLITKGIITNNGTIVTKQQYWNEEFDNQWAMISMPNNNTQAGDYFDGMYLQQWNETTPSWEDIIDPETALTPVKGYSLWDPSGNTFAYTGTPNTGAQSIAISYTEVTGSDNDGANLVGNPYPSFLDWDQISGYGSKYTWNGSDYDEYTDEGTGSGSQYVEPMEGFFIITNSDGTFRLDNSMRCHPQIPGKSGEQKSIDNGLVLTASNGSYDDELWLMFNDAAAEGFELERDAWKLLSGTPGISQLWTECPDGKLAVDVRPHTETIQLGFANDQAGIYSISLKDIADITEPILEDTKTNTFHNLTKGAYEFAWDIADDETRFKLHLNAVGIQENPISESNILIYAAHQQIFIKGAESGEVTVSDLMGRIVLRQEITGEEKMSLPVNLETGIYLVTVQNGMEIKTEKVFFK